MKLTEFVSDQLCVAVGGSMRIALTAGLLLLAAPCWSETDHSQEGHRSHSCPAALIAHGQGVSTVLSPEQVVLTELADLRAAIDRATAEKTHALAYVLGLTFGKKLEESMRIGISAESLASFIEERKKTSQEIGDDEKQRREKAIEAEKSLRPWHKIAEFKAGDYGSILILSPDGSRVLHRTENGAAIRDLLTGDIISQIKGAVPSYAHFSPDSRMVVTTDMPKGKPENNNAYVWDAVSGRMIFSLQKHQSLVSHAVFSPDGKTIVTTSLDQSFAIWDAADGTLLYQAPLAGNHVERPSFTLDGNAILLSHKNRVDFVESATGRNLHTVEMPDRVIEVLPRDQEILIVDQSGAVRLYSYPGYKEISKFQIKLKYNLAFVELSADGSKLIALTNDYSGGVWNVQTGKPLAYKIIKANSKFTPNGKMILTAPTTGAKLGVVAPENSTRFIDVDTGRTGAVLPVLGDFPMFAFTQDGNYLVTKTISNNGLAVWTQMGDEGK